MKRDIECVAQEQLQKALGEITHKDSSNSFFNFLGSGAAYVSTLPNCLFSTGLLTWITLRLGLITDIVDLAVAWECRDGGCEARGKIARALILLCIHLVLVVYWWWRRG